MDNQREKLNEILYNYGNDIEHLRGEAKIERRRKAHSAILALVLSVEEIMDIINENYNTNYGLATALHRVMKERFDAT